MLEQLKEEANMTLTENGAETYISTKSHCLDLFSTIGAIRSSTEKDIIDRFVKAYSEDKNLAVKTFSSPVMSVRVLANAECSV